MNYEEDYINWIYRLVGQNRRSYKDLLNFLYKKDFRYSMHMDANRFEDGVDLRYRYGYDNNIPSVIISSNLDYKPASVLEVIVSLAIRCEENIMSDPDLGDRTAHWFWCMMRNLGLEQMEDNQFDAEYAEGVIERFLDRQYQRNGKGGLFVINNCQYDLRAVEIWTQAMWYLDMEVDW